MTMSRSRRVIASRSVALGSSRTGGGKGGTVTGETGSEEPRLGALRVHGLDGPGSRAGCRAGVTGAGRVAKGGGVLATGEGSPNRAPHCGQVGASNQWPGL